MRANGVVLTQQETHKSWCAQLVQQQSGLDTVDATLRNEVNHMWKSVQG